MVEHILSDYDTVVIANGLPFDLTRFTKAGIDKISAGDLDNDGEQESIITSSFSSHRLQDCYYLAEEAGVLNEFKNYLAEKTDNGQRNIEYALAFVADQQDIKPLQIYTDAEVSSIELREILDVNHDGYLEIILEYFSRNEFGFVRGFAMFEYDKQKEQYVEVLRNEAESDQHDFIWLHLPYLFAREGWPMYNYAPDEDLPSVMFMDESHVEMTVDQGIDPN